MLPCQLGRQVVRVSIPTTDFRTANQNSQTFFISSILTMSALHNFIQDCLTTRYIDVTVLKSSDVSSVRKTQFVPLWLVVYIFKIL